MNDAISDAAPGRNQNPGRQDEDSQRGTKQPAREDKQDRDKRPRENKPGQVDPMPEQTDPPVPGRTPVQIP